MCTRSQCEKYVGKWIKFRTPYGVHQGIIERIDGNEAVILSPRKYVPVELASIDVTPEEFKRLDVALAFGGYPGCVVPQNIPYGYGAWGCGWARWAVAFLVIFLLFGLFCW